MGLEDYKRRRVANAIMLSVGLFEKSAEICRALGRGKGVDVLAEDVFPVVVDLHSEHICICIVSVSEAFWPLEVEDAESLIIEFREYIKTQVGEQLVEEGAHMFFAPAREIPRTAAPLLKPKVGDMKKKLQTWLDAENPSSFDENTCLKMCLSLKLDE